VVSSRYIGIILPIGWFVTGTNYYRLLKNCKFDRLPFGDLTIVVNKANILSLLWTYLVKADGTKKARCCCNGNPGRKGSITLAHTYVACVEQPAQRVYWGLVVLRNFIDIGADASNAFAEAPPPKAPLYVLVDRPYREWYKRKKWD